MEELNLEQEVFISRLKQLMDEMYGLIKHAPALFPEQIKGKIHSSGDILQVGLSWSFQSNETDPLHLCIEEIRVGNVRALRFDSSWDEWDLEVPTNESKLEQSRTSKD